MQNRKRKSLWGVDHLAPVLRGLSLGIIWAAIPLLRTVGDEPLRLATFDVDASPSVGTPMAYDLTKGVSDPLRFRGVVLMGAGEPIVLATVDWLGIANASHLEFRRSLAEAAGTSVDRVALHTLHQHDAPRCDGSASILLGEPLSAKGFDLQLWQRVQKDASEAIRVALPKASVVTHVGVGQARIDQVASNRRMLDPSGKVYAGRMSSCRDETLRGLPDGVIDPMLRTVLFYDQSTPVACLTYYATHPQSYYRTGIANPDFPGMARDARQKETGVFHLHFNGAAGNVAAGKYNDGSVPLRQVLADRVAEGMKSAWASSQPEPIAASSVQWSHQEVVLPLASHLDPQALQKQVEDPNTPTARAIHAAEQWAYWKWNREGHGSPIQCLQLNQIAILHLPGELFVEYQIAAQQMAAGKQVCMAAYGDYGPFYIGTRVAYPQGGYETSPSASNVAPEVEKPILEAMERALGVSGTGVHASDFTETFGPGPPAKP
jgi:hypothetical protein